MARHRTAVDEAAQAEREMADLTARDKRSAAARVKEARAALSDPARLRERARVGARIRARIRTRGSDCTPTDEEWEGALAAERAKCERLIAYPAGNG